MTPYRSAQIGGRIADPSRTRFGFAGAAVGALACFVSLVDLHLHRWTRVDNVFLFGGSAAILVLLAYSSIDAPAGRGVLLASLGAFAFSFVPQIVVHSWMGTWVWACRYIAISGVCAGLLLRLRRTRPGAYGAFLRLAGVVALWWGVQHVPAIFSPHARQSVRAELFSRVVYVLLALGLLDMRRWVGAVPARDAARTPIDTAREIATTRVCLGIVSVGAAATTLTYAWHSEWGVIATAEMVAVLVTLTMHIQWILRESGLAVLVVVPSLIGVGLALSAFGTRSFAVPAAALFALGSVVADVAVLWFAAPLTKARVARSAYALALAAIALHAIGFAIVATRLGGPA